MKPKIVVAALVAAIGAIPAVSVAGGIGPAGSVRSEQLLKAREQEKLGETIRDWIDSWTNERVATSTARDVVQAELDKWAKKRELAGRHPLSLTEDIGRALWYSKDYERAKGIRKGRVSSVETETRHRPPREIEYGLLVPGKYRAQAGPYPLILCLPDAGEKPEDHLREQWTTSEFLDTTILAAVPMPEDTATWLSEDGLAYFFTVFLDVSRTYAIDFDRVYLAGRGRGVEMVMYIGASFPDRFAGIVGRMGDAGSVRPENFRNLPTFFAGAGKQATDFKEACKQAGHDNVTLMSEGKEDDLWAWIQQHARLSNPEEVVLLPGAPIPNKAYWVQVPNFDNSDGKALLRAKVDKAENRITLEGKGISQVTLNLSDAIVDLDRPVKVVCNGVEHEDLIQRNLGELLNTFYVTRSDPGKLYTASMTYDLPAARE